MTSGKLQSLKKYAADLKDRLKSAVPPKHSARPEAYKAFLERELTLVTKKLEEAAIK